MCWVYRLTGVCVPVKLCGVGRSRGVTGLEERTEIMTDHERLEREYEFTCEFEADVPERRCIHCHRDEQDIDFDKPCTALLTRANCPHGQWIGRGYGVDGAVEFQTAPGDQIDCLAELLDYAYGGLSGSEKGWTIECCDCGEVAKY